MLGKLKDILETTTYALVLLVSVIGLFWAHGNKEKVSNLTDVSASAIYGTNYLWVDSLSLSTSAVDSHFAVLWQDVSLWADGCDLRIRVGSPDTTSWSSRKWSHVIDGQVVSFGPATKLKRLEYKAATGTGTLILMGYKKSAQY